MGKRCIILITSVLAALLTCFAFSDVGSETAAAFYDNGSRRAHVEIAAEGKTYVYDDDPIVPSDFSVAEEIEKRGINASLNDKMKIVDEYLRCGADYKTALNVCFPRLVIFVNGIADKLYKPPVDSEVKYENGAFSATEHSKGKRLDENALYCSVYYTVRYGTKERIEATTVDVEPKLKKDELKKNLVLRGEYTTEFRTSTKRRANNIKLALSKVDGIRIESGGVMSFNAVVGERTEENGFETAKIISDGKYVDGVGGGVCQASTAVYNAALRAGLKCVANAHSICPSYCDPGLDAMISSVSDFTVYNDTGKDVYVSAKTNGASATVKFYGVKNEYTIMPRSEVVSVDKFEEIERVDTEYKFFAKDAPSGDRMLVAPGRDGYESVTYLCYYRDGVMIKRERIRANTYKSSPQIIAIAA